MKRKIKKLMKNKNLMFKVILGVLIFILAIILIISKIGNKHNINNEKDLYGTYAYIKTTTNENEVDMNIIVKIIFRKDKTAIFETSNGYASEMTKGVYEYKDGKITYTKKNYYKPYAKETEEPYTNEESKIVTFEVYNRNKLKQKEKFYGQEVIMERVE